MGEHLDTLEHHIITSIRANNVAAISRKDITTLLTRVQSLFQSEGPLLRLGDGENDSFYILGDIHGQYDDMSHILYECSNRSPQSNYIFLGDYVDRGTHSLQVILCLFAMKSQFPNAIHMLRGNHESCLINEKYGFLQELQMEFGIREGIEVHEEINNLFQYMPIAAVVYDRVFCVHGGISAKLSMIEDIQQLKFPINIDLPGTMANDILWADPSPEPELEYGYKHNRGPTYGKKAVKDFLHRNRLDYVLRAHQCVDGGFESTLDESVLTVFSAPNYCDRKNKAAAVIISKQEIRVLQFSKLENGTLDTEDLCFEGVPNLNISTM